MKFELTFAALDEQDNFREVIVTEDLVELFSKLLLVVVKFQRDILDKSKEDDDIPF